MDTIISQVINYVINVGVVAIGGFLVREIVIIAPQIIKLIVAKVGLTNYTKNKSIALDIWNKIEEDGRLGELVESKLITFEKLIKKAIPSITDADIDLFNKSIAGEFNKDKIVVVKAVEEVEPTIVTVIPIIKYVNEAGIELQLVGTVL